AASLRSPMFQIAGDTLFWLSHYAKSVWSRDSAAPLWNGVERFAEIPEISEPEKEKLSRFLRITSELAVEKDRLRLAELMDKILAGTSYGLTVLADPNGVRRYANLRKLSRLARTLESSGPMPLGLFIYTLKRLEMQEVREGEAQVEAETAGKVVRIMSVHKAKGLEFPVVFVADMGRSRRGESDETFLCDYQQGFSFRLRNERLRDWEDPAPWRRIKEVLKKRTEEEWERLFYVAVTRAKDRLILSGVYERPKKEKESSPSWIGTCQLAEKELASFCKRWEGTEGARRRPRGRDPRQVLLKRFGDFKPRSDEEILGGKKEAETVRERALSILKNTMPFEKPADKVIDLPVSAYAAYAKSAADYRRVYEIGYPDAREFEERLDTNGSEEVSAADFGTTFHRFMEKLDFRASRAAAMKRLEKRFESLGPKSATRARAMLERFMDSGLLKALRAAAEIHREIPFLLNERRGLIHGVIDVLFRDPDGSWHVLDYKTGEGSEEKILRSGYDRQVDLYAHAVAKILKIPPVSGILYFFGNGWQYDRPIDREVAKRIEAELRRTQEELLETRQKIG
ncbi:MAG: 3'-5' exonuclease, partial [Candidatus Omnitrophota bacterium]